MKIALKDRDQTSYKFGQLAPGTVFRSASGGRLLLKVRYCGGLGLGQAPQFGERHIAVYLHSGFTHIMNEDDWCVPVEGEYVISSKDLTPEVIKVNKETSWKA